MASFNLPDAFADCYIESACYPLNMVNTAPNTSPEYLEGLDGVFNEASENLFVDTEDGVDVPWRDLDTSSGEDLRKRNIHDAQRLADMIGLSIDGSTKAVTSAQPDPQCRFIYLSGDTFLSALNITRSMFTRVLTYHQVMPAYLEFVMAFGSQDEAKDLGFSSFKTQVCLAPRVRLPEIQSLGRSGQQYQLCYNLKHIDMDEKGEFSLIRQAAIHHQFDVVTGKALWIVTAGRFNLQQRFKSLTGKNANPRTKSFSNILECLESSLAAHAMFCSWSTENWRWYIKSLESTLRRVTTLTAHRPLSLGEYHQSYGPDDLQELQRHEDMVHETVAALEANYHVIGSLSKLYDSLKHNKDFPLRADGAELIDIFTEQAEGYLLDTDHLIQRASTLLRTTKGWKDLVIQQFQSQLTKRVERTAREMGREQRSSWWAVNYKSLRHLMARRKKRAFLVLGTNRSREFLLHRTDEMATSISHIDGGYIIGALVVESPEKPIAKLILLSFVLSLNKRKGVLPPIIKRKRLIVLSICFQVIGLRWATRLRKRDKSLQYPPLIWRGYSEGATMLIDMMEMLLIMNLAPETRLQTELRSAYGHTRHAKHANLEEMDVKEVVLQQKGRTLGSFLQWAEIVSPGTASQPTWRAFPKGPSLKIPSRGNIVVTCGILIGYAVKGGEVGSGMGGTNKLDAIEGVVLRSADAAMILMIRHQAAGNNHALAGTRSNMTSGNQ
ncbi:hypothetical protein O1611_g5750 [Lasiodiplodia mahajangana]|uniref:Uncharacterized protein n=1 Tax=Lasiodiplodia mahajangana TaxID=1108764 RepID=A0ACC2JKA8_9PEZI|nr:hypothetical protein O1611_g5750 [Lasiodiplodia mahajangana]